MNRAKVKVVISMEKELGLFSFVLVRDLSIPCECKDNLYEVDC